MNTLSKSAAENASAVSSAVLSASTCSVVSSSVMVAVAVALAVSSVTPVGKVLALIAAVKVSSPSTSVSPAVCTCSVADVLPEGIVMLVAACAV